jgi:hypothetical protein
VGYLGLNTKPHFEEVKQITIKKERDYKGEPLKEANETLTMKILIKS